ncbi:hypothetical protein ACQ4LE_005292 [Meloidogyne hapla]|uniref:Ankyrin repeat protein n=1 Tax=Meloidogyne hapla TaxID=6305 RepID=A0A1I8B3G0_MELHA
MCIIRCWLERLSRCAYKDAEFENIIFNPTLIKLLFEHEKNPSLQFYTKETTLHYCIANFELQAIKFVKDHLKISKKISIDFSLCNNNLEQCNGVILKILNEGVKLPHVCIISKVNPSIVELIKNKIITSTNCSNIVPRIEFEVDGWARFWNFNYLHRRDGVTTKEFIYYGTHYYSSSYEIANINDPNVVFLINYEGTTNIYRNLAFTIQRK